MMSVYSEGSVVALPLREGSYAVGVLARIGKAGGLLGYFFPQRYTTPPKIDEVSGLTPEDAVYVGIFGDLGLQTGAWQVLGRLLNWDRDQWPIPRFVRHEELTGRSYLVLFGDDLGASPKEQLTSIEDTVGLPEYKIAGAGAMEIRMTRLSLRTAES